MKKLRRISRDVDPETGDVRYFRPGNTARYEAVISNYDPTTPLPESKGRKAAKRRRKKSRQQALSTPAPYAHGRQPRPLFTERLAPEIDLTERYYLRREVFSAAGYRCEQCDSPHQLTLDHVVPLSRGGGWHRGNLQALCQSCNQAKADRMPYEQRPERQAA